MRKSPFLSVDDNALMAALLENLAFSNPRLKIGERLSNLTETVWKGKVVREDSVTPLNSIFLDFQVPHVEPKRVTVEVQTIRLKLKAVEKIGGIELDPSLGEYLYPYDVRIPHKKWLVDNNPGDTVIAADDNFNYSPYVLTEEDFERHSYFLFRFATTN